MTAQFTPGPWALEKFTVRGENNNVLIGQAYFPRGSKDPSAERKANARLIAAAPELYEALQAALPYLDRPAVMPTVERDKITTALAKVRGDA